MGVASDIVAIRWQVLHTCAVVMGNGQYKATEGSRTLNKTHHHVSLGSIDEQSSAR